MAEKACREGASSITRRQSFRKSLAEAGLPPDYLDKLEQKRKQLDESIHKYIAAKEREYKTFERDLRLQYKLSQDKEGAKPRRTSPESTQGRRDSPRILGQQQSVVDALLAAGLRRDQVGQSVALSAIVDGDGSSPTIEAKSTAGLTGRRASFERDKELVGVFTPAYLPALQNKGESQPQRTSSEPPLSSSDPRKESEPDGVHRANSDSYPDVKARRPELQLVQRTSSSGSSADGRLASAMKSLSHPRSKRKRVSLAVGDTIVAPSDNVPTAMSHNSTPSHSRTRSPAPDRKTPSPQPIQAVESLRDVRRTPQAPSPFSRPRASVDWKAALREEKGKAPGDATDATASSSPPASTSTKTKSTIDADGDLFDLDEENDQPRDAVDLLESEDEVTGRVGKPPSSANQDETYDPNAGLVPDEPDTDVAEHVEFMPGSAVASQQPTNPGFRRPSASLDPVYMGASYDRAEHDAVVNDVYGSSFTRPASKGSFGPGSLGESFMQQNAEQLSRLRAAREQPRVGS